MKKPVKPIKPRQRQFNKIKPGTIVQINCPDNKLSSLLDTKPKNISCEEITVTNSYEINGFALRYREPGDMYAWNSELEAFTKSENKKYKQKLAAYEKAMLEYEFQKNQYEFLLLQNKISKSQSKLNKLKDTNG